MGHMQQMEKDYIASEGMLKAAAPGSATESCSESTCSTPHDSESDSESHEHEVASSASSPSPSVEFVEDDEDEALVHQNGLTPRIATELESLASDIAFDVVRNDKGEYSSPYTMLDYDEVAGELKDVFFTIYKADKDTRRVGRRGRGCYGRNVIRVSHYKMAVALMVKLCDADDKFCPGAGSIEVRDMFITALSLALKWSDDSMQMQEYVRVLPSLTVEGPRGTVKSDGVVEPAYVARLAHGLEYSAYALVKTQKPVHISTYKKLEVEFLAALGWNLTLTPSDIDWSMGGAHPFGEGNRNSALVRHSLRHSQ